MASPFACWQSRKRQHSPELISPQPQRRPFSPASWTMSSHPEMAAQTHKRRMESPEPAGEGKRRKVDLRLGFEGMTLNQDGRPTSPPLSAQKHESPPVESPALDIEEVTGWQPNAQQGRVEEPSDARPDGINVEELPEDDIYEIPRREHDLYELEDENWHYIDDDPDRIHVSSLSDTSSSSPPSPTSRGSTPQPGSLEQPGRNGFTISPSFLTHMLRANANAAANVPVTPLHWDPDREKKLGLVLYRQPHSGYSVGSEPEMEMDSGRIQEIDEGNTMELDEPMDVDMGGEMEIE